MPTGNVTLAIKDGGLGLVSPSVAGLVVHMGVCSLGTANTLYSFGSQDDLSSTLGTGPAVEAAALRLAVAGGSAYVMPVTASVAGNNGSVTPTRVGTSTGTVTAGGVPLDGYSVVIKITSAGTGQLVTGGNVTFTYSLDGGNTTSQNVSIPVGGGPVSLTGTGLTVSFSVTTTNFDKGDSFAFTANAPYYSTTDLANAFTALLADARTWGLVHVVGYPTASTSSANATSGATFATAVATQMASAAAAFRYARAIVEAPPSLDSDLITAYASFADTRVMVKAGTEVITSPLTGRQLTRHSAWSTVARLAAIPISESPGRTASGPLIGVVKLVRDERVTPGLFDQRFCTNLTYTGFPGNAYCDEGRMMAALGSDFSYIMNGRVMDVACTVTRQGLMFYLNSSVRVSATTGTIFEEDARGIESYIGGLLNAALVQPGYASSASVLVNRTDNILSTQTLRVKTRIVPLAYAAAISEDIGFLNPSLTVS